MLTLWLWKYGLQADNLRVCAYAKAGQKLAWLQVQAERIQALSRENATLVEELKRLQSRSVCKQAECSSFCRCLLPRHLLVSVGSCLLEPLSTRKLHTD